MSPFTSPRRLAVCLSLAVLTVVLAACGGGGGGGGGAGDTGFTVHLLVVNKSADPASVIYTGAAAEPEATAESCDSLLVDYPLFDPFTITVNGNVAFDSTTLAEGLPNGGAADLVLELTVNDDGTVEAKDPKPGRRISPPGTTFICPTLPG